MGISKAQMKAVQKYSKKAYYRPCVCLKREYEEALKAKAEQAQKTVSQFIQDLIMRELEKD